MYRRPPAQFVNWRVVNQLIESKGGDPTPDEHATEVRLWHAWEAHATQHSLCLLCAAPGCDTNPHCDRCM